MITLKNTYVSLCQKIGAFKVAPTNGQIQFVLFAVGVSLLALGTTKGVFAQGTEILEDHDIAYNDTQVAKAIAAIMTYIEGSFGALVMVGSGIAAILSSAFGQYRAALGCLVVAVGAFILRSFMSTFFNTESFDQNGNR